MLKKKILKKSIKNSTFWSERPLEKTFQKSTFFDLMDLLEKSFKKTHFLYDEPSLNL